MRAIAGRLAKMKVPTWADIHKNGFKKRERCKWTTSTLGVMLSDETYAGTWYYGKRGKAGKVNPRDHWLAVEVPAIVSRDVWEKAQERRERNKEMARRNTKHEYLMGRRVTCGECGRKMVGRPITSGNGKKYLYYYCPAKMGMLASKQCDTKYFNAKHVDTAVWEWVREILLNPEALRASLKEQQTEQERANQPLRNRLAVIDDLLADNRRQLEKLLDLYLTGDFDKEMLTERKNRLETTITALEQERADLVTTLESQTLTDDQILTIESFAREVAGGLAVAEESFEARRHLIDLLDVQVTLAIEEGQRVAYARCLVDETALSVESTSSGTIYADKCNSPLLLAPDT